MPNLGIKATVLDFLVNRAGVPTSINMVSNELGITRAQASQSLAAFVIDGNAGVIRVSNGIYAYVGPSVAARPPLREVAVTTAPQLSQSNRTVATEPFTIIGKNKLGELLIRDDSGTVYRLVEV